MVVRREDKPDSDPELLAQLEKLREENAALEETLERLRFAIDGTSDGLWFWDVPSGEEWWSESLRKLLGYTAEELPARNESWVSLLHPDERDDVLKLLERHLEQGEPYDIEYRLRTKARGFRWFHVRGRCEKGNDGRSKRMAGSVKDITERKEAEHGLRLSDQVIENMAGGVNLTRMDDGVMVYTNPRFEEIFGYGSGELIGQPVAILNASSEQNPEGRAQHIIQAVKERGFWSGEIHNVKKDGKEFWSRANVVAFEHSDHGSVLLSVVEDITERKDSEHGLRLYAQIMEHMAEGVSLIRQGDGVIVYANPRFEEIYGYEPGELISQHVSILNAPSDRAPEETAKEIIQAVEDHGYWSGEIHNVKKDGTEIWSWANMATFEHREYGTVMIAVQEDISERVRARAARHESERRLRAIIDSIVTFVGLYTVDGVLIETNQAPLDAAGLTREEVLGKPFWETYWWSYSEDVQTQLRDALRRAAEGETVRYDVPIRVGESEDGEPVLITIDVTFGPLYGANGEVVQLVGSAVDITQRLRAEEEQRQLEAQVQHAQKLESLGVLAGGIAHDFNNLLVSVLGNASLALEDLPKDSDLAECIKEIEMAAKRAAELCREMLAYSGKGNFVIEAVNLNTLIAEMGQLLSVSISKRCILDYRFADSLPSINADAIQLRQIVMNLIINASEAIGENDGLIVVKTGVRSIAQPELAESFSGADLPAGDYVCLEVTDTGAGIDADSLSKLFDPFFTTKFAGRGLGLAAVMGIVRGHRGALQVTSVPGEGTTFQLLFPIPESVESKPVEQQPDLKNWRSEGLVLVVDDEEKVRTFATRLLKRVGFTVLSAQDGAEGVEVFESHRDEILFVLLDLTMPRMNGEEAFRRIRSIRDDVPVLFSSGYTEEEILERLEAESGIAFVQKPYTVAALAGAVRALLEGLPSL